MKLNAKETKILTMLAQGKQDKEICPVVGLAHGSLRNLMRVIYAKLDAKNRTEAAVKFERIRSKDDESD